MNIQINIDHVDEKGYVIGDNIVIPLKLYTKLAEYNANDEEKIQKRIKSANKRLKTEYERKLDDAKYRLRVIEAENAEKLRRVRDIYKDNLDTFHKAGAALIDDYCNYLSNQPTFSKDAEFIKELKKLKDKLNMLGSPVNI